MKFRKFLLIIMYAMVTSLVPGVNNSFINKLNSGALQELANNSHNETTETEIEQTQNSINTTYTTKVKGTRGSYRIINF